MFSSCFGAGVKSKYVAHRLRFALAGDLCLSRQAGEACAVGLKTPIRGRIVEEGRERSLGDFRDNLPEYSDSRVPRELQTANGYGTCKRSRAADQRTDYARQETHKFSAHASAFDPFVSRNGVANYTALTAFDSRVAFGDAVPRHRGDLPPV